MCRLVRRQGFSLVELLVVVAILAVLVGLLLPAVQSARESARRAACTSNMRQIGLAVQHAYDHLGRFPAGWSGGSAPHDPPSSEDELPGWGWAAHLLPQIDAQSTFDGIDFRKPVYDAADESRHASVRRHVVTVFLCPSDSRGPTEHTDGIFSIGHDDGAVEHDEHEEDEDGEAHGFHPVDGPDLGSVCDVAKTNYVASFGGAVEVDDAPHAGDGIFFRNSRVEMRHVTDGLSRTILLGERGSRLGCSTWTGVIAGAEAMRSRIVGVVDHGLNAGDHFDDYSSGHPGGASFVFGDGSSRFMRDDVDAAVLQALATRAGGESTGQVR